jgi:hypothetical protein
MKKNRRRCYYVDETDDSILEDGETFRLPIHKMADAARSRPDFQFTPERITDGTDSPLALNKPGPRVPVGGSLVTEVMRDAKREALQEARDAYEQELRDAYRDPDRTGVGSRGSGPVENAQESTRRRKPSFQTTGAGGTDAWATREGGCGGDRNDEDDGYDEKKDAMSATDAREAAYAEYQNHIRNAWRNP